MGVGYKNLVPLECAPILSCRCDATEFKFRCSRGVCYCFVHWNPRSQQFLTEKNWYHRNHINSVHCQLHQKNGKLLSNPVEMRAKSRMRRICDNNQTSGSMTTISHIAIDMQRVIRRYLTRVPNPAKPGVHIRRQNYHRKSPTAFTIRGRQNRARPGSPFIHCDRRGKLLQIDVS